MAKKDRKKLLAQIKIGKRIFRDIVIGFVASFLLCVVFTEAYDAICAKLVAAGFNLPEFNYQDLFFTELSIAFLVISFVTLLANKTEDVYWVDVIQYRLVKPEHTSIVDISSYIFANMIISLFAYLIPTKWNLLLFSFVQIILLLGLLSLKLLMAFFGIEDLKKELEEEYIKALDFRKTVLIIHNHKDRDIDTFSAHAYCYKKDIEYYKNGFFKSEPLLMKFFIVCDIVKGFFTEYLRYVIPNSFKYKSRNSFEKMSYKEFNEDTHIDYRDGSIEQIYEKIINTPVRPKMDSAYIIKQYLKLYKYSLKFDGNVNAHAGMMDSLYTNTINAIEHKEIKKSCEQIAFMFRYKEYRRALSCMLYALDNCPSIFVKVFTYIQNEKISSVECIKMLNEMIVSLMNLPEYKIYNNSIIIRPMFLFMSNQSVGLPDTDGLLRQYQNALQTNNTVGITVIYDTLASRSRDCVLKNIFSEWYKKNGDAPKYRAALLDDTSGSTVVPQYIMESLDEHLSSNIERITSKIVDEHIANLFDQAISSNNYEAVSALLRAHCQWLEDRIIQLNSDKWIWHLNEDNYFQIGLFVLSPCDLVKIYQKLEEDYRKEKCTESKFIECMDVIGECFDLLFDWKMTKHLIMYLDKLRVQIIKPLAATIVETGCTMHLCRIGDSGWQLWHRVEYHVDELRKAK